MSVRLVWQGTAFVPRGMTMSIGRNADCDVSIDDETLSRRHAVVHIAWNGVVVEDLGSRNGTFVNDERVHGRAPIKPGDTLVLGKVRFAVEAAPLDATAPQPAPPMRQFSDTMKDMPPPTRRSGPAVIAALAEMAIKEHRFEAAGRQLERFLAEAQRAPADLAGEAVTIALVQQCLMILLNRTGNMRWQAASAELQRLTGIGPAK
jgi:predicted component of type VI protein secretion system